MALLFLLCFHLAHTKGVTGKHRGTLGMNRKRMNRNKNLGMMKNESSLSKLTRNKFAL